MKEKLTKSVICCALAFPAVLLAQDYTPPRTEWGAPDLQGNWKNATVMPFERPSELGTKQAYT